MQEGQGNVITLTAGEDLEIFRRVKLSSTEGEVEYSDDATFIGVTQKKVSDGDMVPVALKTSGRSFDVIITGTCSFGDALYGAADGTVGTTVNGSAIGKAIEASAEALARIEMLFS